MKFENFYENCKFVNHLIGVEFPFFIPERTEKEGEILQRLLKGFLPSFQHCPRERPIVKKLKKLKNWRIWNIYIFWELFNQKFNVFCYLKYVLLVSVLKLSLKGKLQKVKLLTRFSVEIMSLKKKQQCHTAQVKIEELHLLSAKLRRYIFTFSFFAVIHSHVRSVIIELNIRCRCHCRLAGSINQSNFC